MKAIAILVAVFIILSPSITFEKEVGNVLYVGGSGAGNYTSIQDAINDAVNGYIIYVYPKQYNESVVINKSISLIGIVENGEKPIIHGIGNKSALVINADRCILKNFILKSKEVEIAPDIAPSCVINSDYNIIENNTFMYGWCSLYLYNASYNTIKNNEITHGYWEGMELYGGKHNNIIKNTVVHNLGAGIETSEDEEVILYNNVTRNGGGIDLWCVSNCTVSFNHAYRNGEDGINADMCNNITMKNNILHDNGVAGIQMMDSSFCIIEENEIDGNYVGIMVQAITHLWEPAHNNIIAKNNICSNNLGIYLEFFCKDNYITYNNFDNSLNAYFWFSQKPFHNIWYANYWNDWKLSIPRPIIGNLDVITSLFVFRIPWFMFDFHPAMKPYEIYADSNF